MNDFQNTQASDSVIGLPPVDALPDPTIAQGYSDTCAIRSQEIILRDFGVEIPQEELIAEAAANGWYHEGSGTPMEDVGNLLESHGIGVDRYSSATIDDLAKCLAEGKKVIVGVDSGELWGDMADSMGEDNHPDHALVVAGIDTSDPLHVQVVLTDPGTGDLQKSYPLEQFMDAWHDSENTMVVTEQPAPATAAGMANFDYEAGHVSSINGMDYDDWVEAHADNFSTPDSSSFDSDGDGIVDSFAADLDHDGFQETFAQDVDGDGDPDMLIQDSDGDGNPDHVAIAAQDGVLDLQEDSFGVAVDTNVDGLIDTAIAAQYDGSAVAVEMDLDGDGETDIAADIDLSPEIG